MEPNAVSQDSGGDQIQSYIIDATTNNQVPIPSQSGDWTSLIQGLRFTHNGKYVCGYVDSSQDLVQLLETYRSVTGTAFSSSANLVQAIKGIDETQLQMRFVSPASRPRLFWQMNAGEPTIRYDGVPFMSIGHGTDLPCVRFGGRRKKIEQVSLPSGEVVPVDYRMKTGCEAKITIRRILRYPCAEYNDSLVQGIAAVRRHRKQILDDLVQRIINGSAKFQERYHFLLPTPMAHNGHAVADIESPPPLAQHVVEEIVSNLSNGMTLMEQIKDHIKSFIISTSNTPGALHGSDQIFFPTEFDVFRQVYWLYKLEQVVDQDGKGSMGILGIDRAISQAIGNQTPTNQQQQQQQQQQQHQQQHQQQQQRSPGIATVTTASGGAISTSASTDSIPGTYNIIMVENGTPEDSASPLDQLGDHQISEHEVELNSTGADANSSHHLVGMMDESVVSSVSGAINSVSGIQIGLSSSPPVVSIPPVVGVHVGGGSSVQIGGHAVAKRSLLQNSVSPVPTAVRSSPMSKTNSLSSSVVGGSSGGGFHYKDSPGLTMEDDGVSQAQEEVQSMLRIIENQMHACKNLSALNTLRRQLTELCGQFSVYLAGGTSEFGTPSAKRART